MPPFPPSYPPFQQSAALSANSDAALAEACAVLQAGGLVAYPSETVWGLAALPGHVGAVQRLYQTKGRAAHRPVQMSCQNADAALELAQPGAALTALSALWPGPLTLVTPARSDVGGALAPGGLVGLRVPSHPLALALLRVAGGRLLTTSCNLSGKAPALTAVQARAMGLADFVLSDPETVDDSASETGGRASTVVLLPAGEVLRSGPLDGAVAAILVGIRGDRDV